MIIRFNSWLNEGSSSINLSKAQSRSSVSIKEPELYDYVVCIDKNYELDGSLNRFLYNQIGIIISITERRHPYHVRYEDIPGDIAYKFDKNWRDFDRDEILYFSKDRGELEDILAARKFNI